MSCGAAAERIQSAHVANTAWAFANVKRQDEKLFAVLTSASWWWP